ncbi:PIG-L deacetylase family protein [Pyrococcus horikoshii]|nr:PIG-L deacetylase family protein [Pyrococcus horikoshii]HII60926.1 PIG-L family deacetylase [Pyrococcus horikoshii]
MFEDIDTFEEAFNKLLREVLEFDLQNPFKDAKKVLCIEPHPDDCVIGMGGTIKKLSDMGVEVIYVCMTDGYMGTTDESLSGHELAAIRRKEEEESARLLGVKKIYWLNYRDTELPYSREVRKDLTKILRKEQPDGVFAPDPWLPYESHPDHRRTGFLAIESVAFSQLPNFSNTDLDIGLNPYNSGSFIALYYTHKPNYIVDITDLMELKLKAIRVHRSQFPDDIWEKWEPFLRTIAMFYGEKIGVRYGEGFRIMPGLFYHITPFTDLI